MTSETGNSVKVLGSRVAPGRRRNPAGIFAVQLPGGIVVHVMLARVRRRAMQLRMPDAGDRSPGIVLPGELRKQVEVAVRAFAKARVPSV